MPAGECDVRTRDASHNVLTFFITYAGAQGGIGGKRPVGFQPLPGRIHPRRGLEFQQQGRRLAQQQGPPRDGNRRSRSQSANYGSLCLRPLATSSAEAPAPACHFVHKTRNGKRVHAINSNRWPRSFFCSWSLHLQVATFMPIRRPLLPAIRWRASAESKGPDR